MKNVLFALSLILAASSFAFAHPPQDIQVKVSGEKIGVTVIHNVDDPSSHYIEEIKVSVNDKTAVKQSYSLQENKSEQPASYIIPGLKKGDKITVSAECCEYGKLKKAITVQ